MSKHTVFFIDDDKSLRLSVGQLLEYSGFTVSDFDSPEAALPALDSRFDGVVLSDVRMPGMDGMELLRRIMRIDADIPVILITAHGDVTTAVEAMHQGAYDFIEKPFNEDTLCDILSRAQEKRRLVLELRRMKQDLAAAQGLDARLVGAHPAMRAVKRKIMDVAPTAAAVLLLGETGTGKEVAARCLHDCSPRAAKPFVVVDCTSIPLSLAESELFGYARGAFTGADRPHTGKLEAAAGGTLFLDEINSMPLEMQGKLLRAMQEKCVTPLGTHSPRPVDFRVMASSNEDLKEKCRQGRFREDLYYRLATFELLLPPLREHKEDIPLLFSLFTEYAAANYGREAATPDSEDMALLMAHAWPGNVRELKNMAARYVLSGSQALESLRAGGEQGAPDRAGLLDHVRAFERQLILDAIKRHKGDMRLVMEELGLPRRTLNEKMAKLGITRAACIDKFL
ncbi:sigma-54-dependent transcriptional regulator [Desulfovibrio legallii]|uniref:Two-component system, NtrC family, C4-dicarboxylate transport response regulator DctD n=1 Tax=Desulfovibrio legallii TaxID=571438 RepID=A0A1G7L4L0_9BACT|nr:sigma-54 dependent transcriptional regulator [Desulfovibrio legallii]SDF44482.1 two-component system, NtrC family, C4-dicarboxylate transport response regulator DctD [Desulfovibrio legallii]